MLGRQRFYHLFLMLRKDKEKRKNIRTTNFYHVFLPPKRVQGWTLGLGPTGEYKLSLLGKCGV